MKLSKITAEEWIEQNKKDAESLQSDIKNLRGELTRLKAEYDGLNVSMRWNAGEAVPTQRFEFDCQPTAILGSNFTVTADEPDTYTLQLKNEATVWNDRGWMTVEPAANKTRAPSRVTFMNNPAVPTFGVEAWYFNDLADHDLHFNWELPHDYMEQTDIWPHVHWSPSTPNPGNVVWELEYTSADPGTPFAFPTTSITVVAAAGGQYMHQQDFFEPLSGGLIERVYVCRITRLTSDPQDSYPDPVYLHITGFKYEANTIGSRRMLYK